MCYTASTQCGTFTQQKYKSVLTYTTQFNGILQNNFNFYTFVSMEKKKPNRKKSKRLSVDVTPEFHQKILDKTYITNEPITTYIIRVVREDLEKGNSNNP
jgi:hypothetical protein